MLKFCCCLRYSLLSTDKSCWNIMHCVLGSDYWVIEVIEERKRIKAYKIHSIIKFFGKLIKWFANNSENDSLDWMISSVKAALRWYKPPGQTGVKGGNIGWENVSVWHYIHHHHNITTVTWVIRSSQHMGKYYRNMPDNYNVLICTIVFLCQAICFMG